MPLDTAKPGSSDEQLAVVAVAALHLLGQTPEPGADVPQTLGALSATVERLVALRVAGDPAARTGHALGYLNSTLPGPGAADAFELLTARLQATSDLLDVVDGGLGPLVRACVDAAVSFAGIPGLSRLTGIERAQAVRDRVRDGAGALHAARVLLTDVINHARAELGEPGPA